MSREKVKELLKRRSTKIGSVVLAAAIVFTGSMFAWKDSRNAVPELVTFVDMTDDVVIEEDETPLAAPTVKKSVKKQTKKKKIKLKEASKKSYTQNGKTTTKTTKKVKKSGKTTTTTETIKETSIKYQFKKGSKIKTQITTITTTVITTTVTGDSVAAATTEQAQTEAQAGEVSAASIAPQVDARVMNAFNKMGCKIVVNPGVNYSGQFDARTRTITLKVGDNTVYHELGHFLAFIAGNYDKGAEFAAIFSKEKSLYTAYNAAYVLSSASEYFAESFRNYTLDAAGLQASRPETFAAIQKCLGMATDAQVNTIMSAYSAIWS